MKYICISYENEHAELLYRHSFCFILAMIVPIAGSFYQRILADIRYATMEKKKYLKEDIVFQIANKPSGFDVSEYEEIEKLLINVFIPCYYDIEKAMEQINSTEIENTHSTDDLNGLLSFLDKWQLVFSQQSKIQKGKLKNLLKRQHLQFTEMMNSMNSVLNSHSDPEMQIANKSFLISEIKFFYLNYLNLLLSLFDNVKTDKRLSVMYDYLMENAQKFYNDPLIDLETPYFFLPVQFAEEKEKQILSYIENGKNGARSIMALIILYIKMKNIIDAEMLYYTMIAPIVFINKQDSELSEIIKLMLEETKNNNPNAYLDKTSINIDENMNAYITEHYFIDRPENNKDVYVLLPYKKDDIVLNSFTDGNNDDLELKGLREFWKNSCCIQFSCNEQLLEFSLKYRVKSFFEYSDNYITYSYQYGGINNNANYVCSITMSNNLKGNGIP